MSSESDSDDLDLADLRSLLDEPTLVTKRHGYEDYRFSVTPAIEIVIHQELERRSKGLEEVTDGTEAISATGAVIWDTSVVISKYFSSQEEVDWNGKRVFELGAGCGLCSITLGSLGANVIATDRNEMLSPLRRNVSANSSMIKGSVVVEEYSWGDLVPPKHGAEIQYIIATDCVYDIHLVEALVHSLQLIATVETVVYIGNDESVGRTNAYEKFLDCAAESFDISLVPKEGVDPEYDRECVVLYKLTLRRCAP